MTTPVAERLAAKHAFFLQDFSLTYCANREGRVQSLSDRRFAFKPGAQWEGDVGAQFENKPRFEFNKVRLAMRRILSEYRNNRISVGFASKDGREADQLADTCAGLYRADEQDSSAQEAYDNCFDEGASGGMGAIRVRAVYEDEDDDDNDRQRLAIDPLYEADSTVFFSLDGKKYDKSDATRCYLLTSMTPEGYENEYGDDPASWPKESLTAEFDWYTPQVVWLAEVYEVEQKSELVHYFRGIALNDDEANELQVPDADLTPEKLAELEATGFRKVKEKRVKRRRIHKYIMNGARILEDCGYIAGKHIPIIPFYGERTFIDGIECFQGHVRLARDAQVLDNMIKSWLAEMASRFDVEKPILSPEEIAGHAQMWAEDSIQKYPYLLKNNVLDAMGNVMPIPMQYTKAPNLPPAMAALAQMAAQSLEDMLGNQQAGEQLQPNQSGKAVELIQNRLDMQVFIYIDNFAKTIKRLGEVWLPMKAEVTADGPAKTVGQNGEQGSVEIGRSAIDDAGAVVKENDLSQAKFDVTVEVGPSSSSKRSATARNLMGARQVVTDPETGAVIDMLMMMNLEGEGMSDVQPYFRRKLVNMGVMEPTKEERAQLEAAQANQQPDANQQFLMASAKKELAAAELNDAKVAQTHADTISKLAEVEQGREAHAIQLAGQLQALSNPQPAAPAQQPPVA